MNRFYRAVDLSKANNDKDCELYFSCGTGTDLLGFAVDFAKHNNTPIDQIRVFEFDNKTQWEINREQYCERCYESIRKG